MQTNKANRESSAITSTQSAIIAGIGDGFFKAIFGDKSFILCLMEFLKDARDWGASKIAIDFIKQGRSTTVLRIVDNGRGMNEENRKAFVSVNMTTALSSDQSGRFGTGTKHLLYSFAKMVKVITVPAGEKQVCQFSFTQPEYQRVATQGKPIPVTFVAKTKETWPHGYPSGTCFEYTLNENQAGVFKGDRLAELLAKRLPMLYRHILSVDGKSLPTKEVVGEVIREEKQHESLGTIRLELYRPKHKAKDEGLRFSPGGEIGEISMAEFASALGDLDKRIPEVYFSDLISGTIAAGFLKSYATEDRKSLSPSLAVDENVQEFLDYLEFLAPQVRAGLRLPLEKGATGASRAAIDELITMCNERYSDGLVDEPEVVTDDVDEPDGSPTPTKAKAPLSIVRHAEVGLDETFSLGAVLDREFAVKHGVRLDSVIWHLDNSMADLLSQSEGSVQLRAARVGRAEAVAEIPQLAQCTTKYQVVTRRQFRLNPDHMTVKVGDSSRIFSVNSDLLKGDITWSCEYGELSVQGNRAEYHATKPGIAMIKAIDSKNPSVSAECEVKINRLGGSDRFLTIKDVAFTVVERTVYNQPVSMSMSSPRHILSINTTNAAFQAALRNGTLIQFLMHEMGYEFTRFKLADLEGADQVDPKEIQIQGCEIFAELMASKYTPAK